MVCHRVQPGTPAISYKLITTIILCQRAPYIATFDPRIGALVISSCEGATRQVGDIIPINDVLRYIPERDIPREGKPQPSIWSKVIAFLGPPHSGKSVLLNAIRIQIQKRLPPDWVNRNFFVLRACPDGEGDWSSESPLDVVRTLRYKNQFDDQFVEQICEELEQLRQQKRLLLVDCGGKLDKKNQRILSLCTHALIVSRDPEQIPEWRGAARLSELEILAEVESVPSDCAEVQGESPLRIRLGQLKRGNESCLQIPEALIQAVTEGLDYETLHHGMESEESG